MLQWKNRIAPAAALVCGLWAAQAQAATYNLVLEGDVGNLQTSSFLSGARQFDLGSIALDGFGEPITLEQGDELSASVTLLNGPFWVPASPNQVFGFEVRGLDDPQFSDEPGAPGVWVAEATFYLGGEAVTTASGSCSNCSFVAVFRTPGAAFAFDEIQLSGQFSNLTAPYTIDSAKVTYQLSQPVPEPATWALWLAGLGLAGVAARRRAAA